MRFGISLSWTARVWAVLPAALLSSPFSMAFAQEPGSVFATPEQVFQESDSSVLDQLASSELQLQVAPVPETAHVAGQPCGRADCPTCNPAAAPKKPAPPVFPGPKSLPATGPYKPVFFDNDFSYMKDPAHEHVFGEELKNMKFLECDESYTFSTGGEIRHRYMNEDNRLRPGGPVQSDNNLWRWRHYGDLKAGTWFRAYVEGIHADSFGTDTATAATRDQAIDVNRWDIQNAFVDISFLEDDFGKHTLRYGRQELLFGRQRLVSPLDWGNTRRNFEGFRYMHKGETHKLDLFAVNPVNSATGFRTVAQNDNSFDHANTGVWFTGANFNYTGIKNTIIEPYWYFLDTEIDIPGRPDGARHLIGSRFSHLMPVMEGSQEVRVWDFDLEGGYQFGKDNRQDVSAGFLTSVLGHTWKQALWTPRVSGLFYYGSGDSNPADNKNNTFNTLFPLGHAYWAISDNLAGQNLYDYSLQASVKPTKQSALELDWHAFDLASSGDKAYNVAGVPVGTPGNGTNLGQALDLYGNYAFNPNFDIQAGYSWFWYGDFIDRTAKRGDATQFYIQTTLRY